MPVTGTPVTTPVVTTDDVRGFLRDVAGQIPNTGVLNVLLDGPEYSDADLNRAIKFTVARYNAITPITLLDQNSINPWVLLVGTAAFLMKSEAFRQLRNQVTAQDGDVAPIGVDDKQAFYNQIAKMCDEEFMGMARGIKTQLNMEACYGSLGSGYRSVSRFHHY
jgi:hypothetical protein